MPKLVDAAEQRRSIREAARRVFARRGVAGTGLAHVAEAAGLGRSSLYHYYPHKRALLRDLAGELLADEETLFDASLAGPAAPLERIDGLVGALVGSFTSWSDAARLLFDLQLRDAAGFRPFFRRIRTELARVIADGQRTGEIDRSLAPDLAAATLIGAVDGLLLQYCVDPKAFPDVAALRAEVVRSARRLLSP